MYGSVESTCRTDVFLIENFAAILIRKEGQTTLFEVINKFEENPQGIKRKCNIFFDACQLSGRQASEHFEPIRLDGSQL